MPDFTYHGETLAFGGTAPKGLLGSLFALLIGLVNGYLTSGTLWWIINRYNYPAFPLAYAYRSKSLLLPPDLLAGGMHEPGIPSLLWSDQSK